MGNGPYLLAEAGGYRVTNADDSENFIANPFSNLELYLMGLARPDEVQPLRFVTDRIGERAVRQPRPGSRRRGK